MHVYCLNETDWIVAESVDDAWQVLEDLSGPVRGDFVEEDMVELDDDSELTAIMDETGEPVTRSCSDWCEWSRSEWPLLNGKTILCSTEG